MRYLIVFVVLATAHVHTGNCVPEWIPGNIQYLAYNRLQALPVVRHDGFLADTHEVTEARLAHLAVHTHEYMGHPKDHEIYYEPIAEHVVLPITHFADGHKVLPSNQGYQVAYSTYNHEYKRHPEKHEQVKPYHGPTAVPVVLPSGHLADTNEVAAAKSHHLAVVAKAKADKYYSGDAEYGYAGAYGYSGSYQGYGIPVVLPDGHIADTYDVAMAKTAHLLAVAHAKADKYYSGHEDYNYGGAFGYSDSYHGYSVPVVLPSGYIADTHEVAAAKAAHMTAVTYAEGEAARSDHHYHHPAIHDDPSYYSHQQKQHVPYLHSHKELLPRFLVDSRDVSAVKAHHRNDDVVVYEVRQPHFEQSW